MQHCYQLQTMSKKKSNFQHKTQNSFNHLCFLVKSYFPTEDASEIYGCSNDYES